MIIDALFEFIMNGITTVASDSAAPKVVRMLCLTLSFGLIVVAMILIGLHTTENVLVIMSWSIAFVFFIAWAFLCRKIIKAQRS